MKHARLIWTGLAVLVVAGTAAFALAGGKTSRTGAAATRDAASSTCSAAMAATCTSAQAAACTAKGPGASAASAAECPLHGTSATAAAAGGCPYMKDAAMKHDGACAPGQCMGQGTSATAASASGDCSMHGAKSAMAAGTCSMGGTKASAASAGSCAMHGAKAAMAAGSCAAHGAKSGAMAAAAEACDACADMASCNSDIAEAGGKVQIVPLKNGLMYVYSAESSAKVRAVQAAVARHAERVTAMNAAGDKARLCSDCREMRGASASGKLTREVVNIESGCLTLVTSNDPRVVSRLYAMAGVQNGAARTTVKS